MADVDVMDEICVWICSIPEMDKNKMFNIYLDISTPPSLCSL